MEQDRAVRDLALFILDSAGRTRRRCHGNLTRRGLSGTLTGKPELRGVDRVSQHQFG